MKEKLKKKQSNENGFERPPHYTDYLNPKRLTKNQKGIDQSFSRGYGCTEKRRSEIWQEGLLPFLIPLYFLITQLRSKHPFPSIVLYELVATSIDAATLKKI